MSAPATIAAPAPRRRNAYIDVLRGLSIFGVVCIHFAGSFVTTDTFAWSPSFHLGLALNQVFSFAVPLFVFMSGYLAGASEKPQALGDYYRARLWRIGLPYLIVSILSFFLLNHYQQWSAQPGLSGRLNWLWQHLLFFGVEPTLYFIPLILQLYLVQPLLKALPGWLNRLVPAVRTEFLVLGLAGLLLALHVTLGVLCDRGSLNYYVWGRPNPLFWMFYFFLGLHYRALAGLLPRRALLIVAVLGLVVAACAMTMNSLTLLDRTAMGASFQFNRLDFAYARPVMITYDLAAVLALAAGIALGWAPRGGVLAYLGRFTLEIYLWHILVLYFGVWRFPSATGACRDLPELIVIICAGATLLIAGATDVLQRALRFARGHRLAVVPVP
ncbi:MAG: acyltransferase [Opitutaceae bacterium]|nr:acyltransferase [Opitutaceae bacterium]